MLSILSGVLGCYMALAGATIRWRHVNRAAAEAIWAAGTPTIVCLWHSRVILGFKAWTYGRGAKPIKVMSSKSRESEIIARGLQWVKVGTIRGSKNKPGKNKNALAATREMLRYLREGNCVAITPDGPRGPRMRATIGAVQIARLSGAPILCFAWSCKPAKILETWDRLVLPMPFARGFRVWAEPIHVPSDADEAAMEAIRLVVEERLNAVLWEADRLAGWTQRIEAAPPPVASLPNPEAQDVETSA
jgi:lysophospholipid acyltransferase (LPLAT)-like uncharacterized protein